jgi:hypothetical protein
MKGTAAAKNRVVSLPSSGIIKVTVASVTETSHKCRSTRNRSDPIKMKATYATVPTAAPNHHGK